METKRLIDYWNRKAYYIEEELDNLDNIYKVNGDGFSLGQMQRYTEMTQSLEKRLLHIKATIVILEVVSNE